MTIINEHINHKSHRRMSATFCTPEFAEYLHYTEYLARKYGHNWKSILKYEPWKINDIDRKEYPESLKEVETSRWYTPNSESD